MSFADVALHGSRNCSDQEIHSAQSFDLDQENQYYYHTIVRAFVRKAGKGKERK